MSDMENSELKEQSRHSFRLWAEFRAFMRDRFSLEDDKASQDEVAANISKGTEFRGVNLWVLICATMVASLGLNVNSAAVIIGAMCISPIMGPIMGIGFSLGINDFDLLKKSVRNFVLMFVVAISTSTLFFFISPLGNASSELLARTTPTTYDVLIAFFGGMAGIVAQSRQDRNSTVSLYGGVRSGDGTVSFFLRGVLPVFHQYGFYRPGYLYFYPVSEVQEEDVSQQIP